MVKDDQHEISIAKTEYREAYNSGDAKRLLAVFGESVTDCSEGEPSFYGAEARRALELRTDRLFQRFKVELFVIIIDIGVRGDFAYDWGWHKLRLIDKQSGAVTDTKYRYFETWTRQFAETLTLAADQYLARRGEDWTIIAGYPWFTDWGRDTMISLPGLTLYTGRTEIAKSILRNFARHTDMGMLPNRFVDTGETAEFNTADATLWFFEAARAYAAVTNDYDFIRQELYSVFTQIIEWHVKGTRYNIKMLDNGLLNAGAPGAQLTWMDAKIGDWVVTPRSGKPVEIQALWYNALRIMEDLAARFGDEDRRKKYSNMASVCSWTFKCLFWNKEANCLYDVVNGGPPDPSIRPNQILAVSLHYSMVSLERARAIVETVERELLTRVGLRTLNGSHRQYRAFYEGDQYSRDSAYHQGTVWPWLLGPFVSAFVRVNGGTRAARHRASEVLSGVHTHLQEAGLGQISEIFDADVPHHPRGCFAQAWSVAEILRALCEDVYQVRATVKHAAAIAS